MYVYAHLTVSEPLCLQFHCVQEMLLLIISCHVIVDMTVNMLIWWQWMLLCRVNHVLWMWIHCLNRRLPFSPTINQWPTSLCQKADKHVGQYHLLCTMNYQALFKSNEQWHSWTLSSLTQWCSQNRVVAWAQVGQHIWCCAICGKLACGSTLF